MGRIVLGVQASGEDASVRSYAHCTPDGDGGVSLLVVNLHPDRPAHVRVEGLATTGARLFQVTSPSLTSRDVDLDGRALRFDGTMPAIEPKLDAVPEGGVELPAASYAFVVLPDAKAPACEGAASPR